jgi:hypothetical protein
MSNDQNNYPPLHAPQTLIAILDSYKGSHIRKHDFKFPEFNDSHSRQVWRTDYGNLNSVWAFGKLNRDDLLIGAWDLILVMTWLHKMRC